MPRLSICIPTYNRSTFLADLLDSILAENPSDALEIVVADDASPDDTAEMIERYRDRFAHFKYIRHPRNIGLDLNFLAVVEAATGDYVWLFGDDDIVSVGGLTTVLACLDRWPGVCGLTLGVADYDFGMKKPVGIRQMPETQVVNGLPALFLSAIEHLGFMSALVFERKAWCEVVEECDLNKFKNYYVQLYIIGEMVKRREKWGLISEICVKFRTENDQFLSKLGWMDRLSVDVFAYKAIIETFFGDSPNISNVLNAKIFKFHIMARIKNARSSNVGEFDAFKTIKFLYPHYKHVKEFWLAGVPMLIAPTGAMKMARKLYQRWAPNSGARRATQLIRSTDARRTIL